MKRHVATCLALALAAACSNTTGNDPTDDAGFDADAGETPDAGTPPDGGFNPGDYEWPVPISPITITPHASWKNQISPMDPFIVGPSFDNPSQPRWVKFSVLMRDPTRVYFQDSRTFPFHHDFASQHLDPFVGYSRQQFDDVSLHEAGQEVILGAVLFPTSFDVNEFGIQLVRQDAYDREMVRILVELVRSAVAVPAGTASFYMPTFEQLESARVNEAFLLGYNIPISSPDRWVDGNGCYALGWALGRLVQVPSTEIDDAYIAGDLLPSDILLTDGVPAEIPYVAGVLSLSPSTPNSHVAILSQSYGTPFAYVKDDALRTGLMSLVGKEVAVRVRTFGGCQVDVVDVDGTLSPQQREEILDVRAVQPIELPALTTRGAISANVDTLTPSDIQHFGGKAANYGVLRTAIPDHVRPGVAFSFDLYTAFMNQPLSTGGTLREAINARLAGYTYPPNLQTLPTDLGAVQNLIRDAQFTEQQKADILAALASFAPDTRLRFRSSTNVEDSEVFTGAGLYESFSGCISDDTDADTTGPSQCDPSESGERGVFRALQRVYASFYNQNAFTERLRHSVDESRAAMGVLVHRTFLDEDELANGVATISVSEFSDSVRLVSQMGAVSVTNPEGGAIPEIVDVDVYQGTAYARVSQQSSLVVLGGTVMNFPADYEALATLIAQVARRWTTVTGRMQPFTLDLEYKSVRDEGLVIRQVRPVPLPSYVPSLTPFLLPEQARLCVFQGEYGDVFANHRLKSIWSVTTEGTWLAQDLMSSPFKTLALEYVSNGTRQTLTGDFSTLPNAAFTRDANGLHNAFNMSGRSNDLTTSLPPLVAPREGPLVTLRDANISVQTDWDTPQQSIEWMGTVVPVTTEGVSLTRCVHDVPTGVGDMAAERTATGANGLSITTRFFHPPSPTGATAGYTAPLRAWDVTTISGLTTQPIALRGYWSQTYRPGHHNFTEFFIFEPRLEEGIAQGVLDELSTRNVAAIQMTVGESEQELYVMGLDGTWRVWE